MSLDDVANITISTQTAGITRQGFGVPMVLAPFDFGTERVQTFGSLAELTAMGVPTGHVVYRALAATLATDPSVPRLMVGKRQTGTLTQTLDITPVAISAGDVFSIAVTGQDGVVVTATYTMALADTVADIVAGLVASFNGLTLDMTATDNTTDLQIVADNGGEVFRVAISAGLSVVDVTADPGTAADLAAILLENDTWYGLAVDADSAAINEAASNWMESNERAFVCSTSDSDVDTSSTTDVASVIQDAGRLRTAVFFDPRTVSNFPALRTAGRQYSFTPGLSHWVYKQISGWAATGLTPTQRGHLDGKNVNYVVSSGGITSTRGGKVSGGEWLDIVRLVDFIRARLQEDLFTQQLNNEKIAYTDRGIQAVLAVIGGRLRGTNGIAASSVVVTGPEASAVPQGDRNNRLLSGVEFSARLEGAILSTNITGRLAA